MNASSRTVFSLAVRGSRPEARIIGNTAVLSLLDRACWPLQDATLVVGVDRCRHF